MKQFETPRQPPPLGPDDALLLQNPRTASSGRRGKRVSVGFSYGFFFSSFFIFSPDQRTLHDPHVPGPHDVRAAASGVIARTSATSRPLRECTFSTI